MCALTARDIELLRLLYEVQYLTSSQLILLGWGANIARARQRLKLLHDAGLTDRFRQVQAHGAAEWIHRLTPDGWLRLVAVGRLPTDPEYTPTEVQSIAYVEHDIQTNALIIELARRAATTHGGLLPVLPFIWTARSGQINPSPTETAHTGSAASRRDPDTAYHRAGSLTGWLHPDATLRGVDQHGRAFSVLIEYDRTRRPSKQAPRLRRYDRFLLEGWRDSTFATDDIPPTVLYVAPTDRDTDALAATADRVLTAWQAPPNSSREHATYPGRTLILFASRQRLLAGDWTITHLHGPPPAARSASSRTPTATATYPVPHLFARAGASPATA